jgi:membrane protein required for colicin V production
MGVNWLDVILILVLIVAFVIGIIKGLVRQIVGILAALIGLFVALAFYPYLSGAVRLLLKNDVVRDFLSFLTIFLVLLLLGWVTGRLFTKAMKGPFKFLNHVLGGVLGALKGVLVCGILIFAMLVFPVNNEALRGSALAPYCVVITRSVIDLIPRELKQAFIKAYDEIFEGGGEDVERI